MFVRNFVSLSLLIASFSFFPAFAWSAEEETAGQAAEKAGKFREALTHYTAALQATSPGSEAEQRLLDRAAAVSSKVTPSPALPAEAERRLVRGQALVESAKDSDAYMRAAAEFRAAVRAAPWLADAYYNLGVVLDKAQRFDEAIRSLKLSILVAPNAKEAGEAQRLIYRIEVRQEETQRARAEAERKAVAKKEEQDRKRREEEARAIDPARLVGRWCQEINGTVTCQTPYHMSVSGNTFEIVMIDRWVGNGNWLIFHGTVKGDQLAGFSRPFIFGMGAHSCPPQQVPMQGRISPDGKRMEITHTQVGAIYDNCAFKVAESQTWMFVKR